MMPRNRMIKSEFWTSEQIIFCSPLARLLFIGLWNFADDNGVHPASHIKIKAEVFPGDNIDIKQIKIWIEELIGHGLLKSYITNEKEYWFVTGWKTHQKIDKPTYRYPPPPSNLINLLNTSSTNTQEQVCEYSTNGHQELVEYSPNSSDERKGKEKVKKTHRDTENKSSAEECSNLSKSNVMELFSHWQKIMNHPNAKLDKSRNKIIENAFKLGYSISDLKQAIDGCKKTPYNMGKNDSGQVYDGIHLIFRNAENIERFMKNAENDHSVQCKYQETDIMSGAL